MGDLPTARRTVGFYDTKLFVMTSHSGSQYWIMELSTRDEKEIERRVIRASEKSLCPEF